MGFLKKLLAMIDTRRTCTEEADEDIRRVLESVPRHFSGNDVLFSLSNSAWWLRGPMPTGNVNFAQWGIHRVIVAASASETNTLADPLKEGILVVLAVTTLGGGGARTISYATKFDQSHTSLALGALDEVAVLFSVPKSGGGFRWECIYTSGTLS